MSQTELDVGFRTHYGCCRVAPVLTTKMNKVMKNEKWWNGFLLGLAIGGILGIVILDLVQRGIL